MAKAPTTFKKNGRTYIISNWDVDKSLETMVWLVKTFGEGFLQLFLKEDGLESAEKISKGDTEDTNTEALEEFVKKISQNLDPKEYTKYAKVIVEGTKCDGAAINFSYHFMGKLGELHALMFEILKHQYSDFLFASGEGESE